MKKLEWSASANFTSSGGSWRQLSLNELEVQVPAYIANARREQATLQSYVLTVVGIDENGNRSLPVSTTLQVVPSNDIIKQIMVAPNALQLADNKHAYTISAQAVDKNGQPLVARRVHFSVVASNGGYSINIKPGEWYVEVTAKEYTTLEKAITVSTSEGQVKDFTLAHRLAGAAARIELRWQATPKDLDAHLIVPPAAATPGGSRIHIYSEAKAPLKADATLNTNANTGYGPENITITTMHPGSYCYSVHNPHPHLGTSVRGATVKVRLADGREFS